MWALAYERLLRRTESIPHPHWAAVPFAPTLQGLRAHGVSLHRRPVSFSEQSTEEPLTFGASFGLRLTLSTPSTLPWAQREKEYIEPPHPTYLAFSLSPGKPWPN